ISFRQKQDWHDPHASSWNHCADSVALSRRRREEAVEIARRAERHAASLVVMRVREFGHFLFARDTMFSGYGLNARASDHIVTATQDVAFKTFMANQISAVMHHFYQLTFRLLR